MHQTGPAASAGTSWQLVLHAQDRSYVVADGFSASVPRRTDYRCLPGHPLVQAIALEGILDLCDKVIGASSNPQYTIQMLVFVKRRDHNRLAGGQVLTHLDCASIVHEFVVGYPGQDANLEARGVEWNLLVWLWAEVMDRGQGLYVEGRRSQSNEHPMPVGSPAGNIANQLLIHQPGFHGP